MQNAMYRVLSNRQFKTSQAATPVSRRQGRGWGKLSKLALGLVLAGLAGGGLGGCNSTPQHIQQAVMYYNVGDYPAAQNLLKPDIVQKDAGFVLNNCRYGSCAVAGGDLTGAEQSFLAAYEVINGVNTNTGGRTLGATLVFEGVKVWKGEPFERAMAHYYLGLIYMIKGDYENARSAYRNSLFKLREYASDKDKKLDADKYKEFESKFALGYFGLGLCYQRLGNMDTAADNFKQAVALRPDLGPVVTAVQKPETNVLMFVDYGHGPARAGKGWYNEESAFGPTPAEAGPVPGIKVTADAQELTGPNHYDMVDTLAMAQDQKWMDIDTIRKTKAVIGTGAMAAGAGVAGYGINRGDTGTALVGLGILAAGAAIAASSQADLRYWEMLPRTVYIVPGHVEPGEHTFSVIAGGSTIPPFKMTVKPTGDTVIYVRLR
ncbi:MAG: tetratricopeptide repeat protein [Phycisphaerae bacterium]